MPNGSPDHASPCRRTVHRFYSGDLVWACSSGHGNAIAKR
ncbi:hypothetical protein CPAR01_05209 [Colletotrichum paranaense]|uniref:Uncharacterized protein n=2 Tax=Colletotrichum acutatum species complex TaxID=2707335 RepID=A0AAI9U3S8_9PEZI|nr:uncharacterized protein CPAR01_05209 [Colletotrichum paranaense]KAK1449828.1 hypothetical protein CMEL01_07164 [Colletotrichum melonis]KAK1541822.1 hypothetical protein CPAR01_05209 [Colletotrichum paranaense]